MDVVIFITKQYLRKETSDIKKLLALLLAVTVLLSSCSKSREILTIDNIIDNSISFIKTSYGLKKNDDLSLLPAEDSICDWVIIGAYEAGKTFDKEAYIERAIEITEEMYEDADSLSHKKATEWHRRILLCKSLGYDPQNFGKKADGTNIDLLKDGVFEFVGGDLGKQGINGYAYALLSSYSCSDSNNIEFINSVIETILSFQEDDGGFSIMAGHSDFDITCMVLTSLSPYIDQENVKNAVEKALGYISAKIENNGYVLYQGNDSSESISQLIITLTSLGIDPYSDERFVKNGKNPVDTLLTYMSKDGGFKHYSKDSSSNILASEQALLAMVSLQKSESGKMLYDFN